MKTSDDKNILDRQFNGTPHNIPNITIHGRVTEEVPTNLCYPGAGRLNEEVLRKGEELARQESEMNYMEAFRREEHSGSEGKRLNSSTSSSSASSSSSSMPSFHPSLSSSSLPASCKADHFLLYGPDVYDFLELLHEVNIAYSMQFRNFSIGCVRMHM